MATSEQQPARGSQPAVDKARQLLYRRLKVILTSGRVIEGDFACLDKQGNLVLSNASEHISSSSGGGGGGGGSSGGGGGQPQQQQQSQLGMVLVPKAQQREVLMHVTLSEKAEMLSLVSAG